MICEALSMLNKIHKSSCTEFIHVLNSPNSFDKISIKSVSITHVL